MVYKSLLLLAVCASVAAQTAKREVFQNADVQYDFVTNSHGEKLRTYITRPKNASGKIPVVFFVGWLSCDSMEYPNGETDGFGTFLRRVIDQSNYATVRMDKPGIGESQGKCETADFNSEISGWKAAFESMAKYDFMDRDRVIVVGLSNGGGFSPLVSGSHPVRGFISAGSWGRSWYEHMIELERLTRTQAGRSPAEVNSSVRALTEFYYLYLIKGMTPGQVLAQHPEWKPLWTDSPDGQYGRPAAFYQQLQALNLGEAWQKIDAPVLVIRGSADNVMSRSDAEAIAQMVNQNHPGHARYVEVEGMTHGLTVGGKFHDPLVPTLLEWMRQQLATK
jgi:pimeloyl-ACP methyl ester carboxylesterase